MLNTVIHGDSALVLQSFPDECIDLTVTSPPYDSLRTYNGYVFDFEAIAKQLFRVTKKGGVVVWIVNDGTINGQKTLSSFRQAIYFQDIGFKIHDVMIWNKGCFTSPQINRYPDVFEYMFVMSNGSPKTNNILSDRNNYNRKG